MREPTPAHVLPREYYSAIGVITVNGALMDQLIELAIRLPLRLGPEQGRVLTNLLLSTTRKIDFLRDILNPMFDSKEIKADFQEVYAKLKSAQKNRSKIVHAEWVIKHSDKSIHIRIPQSDETVPEIEPMPLRQLQNYGSEIARAHKALENFFAKNELKPGTTGQYTWPPRAEGRQFRERSPKKK